jgi:hypothetical protein
MDYGVYYREKYACVCSVLTAYQMYSLMIWKFYPTGKLRAATFGRGIWEQIYTASLKPTAFSVQLAIQFVLEVLGLF